MEDIIVGTPVAGRRHPSLHSLIGMFVNTLPFRNFPVHEQRFCEFLEMVKNRAVEAFENQEYPYESLFGKLEITRDINRSPLFNVMFLVRNIISARPEIEELNWKLYEYEDKTAQLDITLIAEEVNLDGIETLRCDWQYAATLFKEGTIRRFSSYFKEIVREILDDYEIRLAAIEIIPTAEREKILSEFNAAPGQYPKDKTIDQLFAEQVARTPGYIALHGCMIAWMDGEVGANRHPRVCPSPNARNVSLTYSQLNEQSDQLAGLLIEKGVLPDTIIGIMMERSVEMITGIMGILKAGGAYLPIDPGCPPERIDYMLKDSGAAILLTEFEREKMNNCQLSIVNNQLSMKGPQAPFLHHSSLII
jgi:non-ribosomal peptide synthetase component F